MYKDDLIKRAIREGRTQLTEVEAKEIMAEAGIPVVPTRLVKTQKEAVNTAKELGFPVALKIVSPDIIHKSDAGGVRLNLTNAAQVQKAYRDIISATKKNAPRARIEGMALQKMAEPGVEVIIGMSKDAQFGPVMMFGLGGILVELLKDVSFRVVPLRKRDAAEMIREVKGFPLLQGYRGREPVNLTFLEDLILKIAAFVEKTPRVKELDLNPTIATAAGAVVADARMTLES